jgi:hypothetical protein
VQKPALGGLLNPVELACGDCFTRAPVKRYLLKAKVRPEAKPELFRALEDGSFGEGFPFGDLGEVLRTGRVDETGKIRWIEVCYCREYYGVAMHEESPSILCEAPFGPFRQNGPVPLFSTQNDVP